MRKKVKVDKPMIAILDNQDHLLCLLDDYTESNLHTFLQGTAAFFKCSVVQNSEYSQYFKVGNKVSFVWNDISYHFDITATTKNEELVSIQADSLTLELRNEDSRAYKASKAMTFKEYLDVFLFAGDNPIILGINEVADKKLQLEWEGSEDSVLARLFSLANKFGAEIEFETVLNKHWGLDKIKLNVYREHDDKHQGIGKRRTDILLEYGHNIETIEIEENIDNLKTAIHATGKDGLTPASVLIDERDADGNRLYYSPIGDGSIRAVQARNQFMSKVNGEGYIAKNWTYETDNPNVLAAQALAELKKISKVEVTVKIKGYEYLGIGDTILAQDTGYNPVLNLEARISEQDIYFDNPENNTSTFTNVEILKSEVDESLLTRVRELIEENKTYDIQILTTNGYSFKNGQGSTTLTARVMDGPRDVTSEFSVNWYRDTDLIGPDASITVQASSINEKVVYRIIAYKDGIERGRSELTLINVNDGVGGRDGQDGRTSYAHIAYADSADGMKNFSVSDSHRLYIGFYTDFNQADSTNPSAYRWTLIKGADGQDGADGLPGKPGADGRTPYFHTAYADSADGQLGFSTTNAVDKLYMGTCTDYIQSDPTDYRAYTWVKIKGETGDTGPAGRDGKGVKSYAITYQAGTSGVTYPTGNWLSSIPAVPNGQYLWSKTTLTYTDNTTSDTYSVAYFPVNGATGATGNGISSYTAEFYLSTSKTTQSGGSWTTTPPTWSNGKYIWTRYKIGYTNGSTAYTTPHCSSEWEAVNEIIVGGRNLFIDAGFRNDISSETDYAPGKWYSYTGGTFNYPKYDDTCNYLYFVTSGNASIGIMQFFDTNKIIKGKTYSVRTWVKVDANTVFKYQLIKKNPDSTYNWYFRNIDVSVATKGEWVEIKWTFDIPIDDDGIGYGVSVRNYQTGTETALRIIKPKLEIGNMFTDFNFAPEDTQLQIDEANRNIGNKVDQEAYNQDKQVIYDDISKKLDDEEFRKFQKTMNDLKSSYEKFVGEGGRYEQELQNASKREQAIIQDFGEKVQQFNFINTYIRESEEGIVIGAKGNPMQMLLSKDSLSFMDGGQVVAYFSNQSFYINRGAVVDSLQVGVHKMTRINNEFTVIQYVPN